MSDEFFISHTYLVSKFMKRYLYLSLIPESLIGSQLTPEEFGNYYAVGRRRRSSGQAIFFEIDRFESDTIDWECFERHCVKYPDGRPKRSSYLAIYRVLEQIPLSALRKLYLTTDDGRVLGLSPGEFKPESISQYHLYQELCPITPGVVSKSNPIEFCQNLTDRSNAVSVDKLVFAELKLNRLGRDPESNAVGDLPYKNIGHLRDCLRELESEPAKVNKLVSRSLKGQLLFRTIKNGFFIGNGEEMLYYPMPSEEELAREHHEWWRSALSTFGE
jgi:hypothetical protein